MGGVAVRVLRDIVQGKRLAIMRVDVNQSILNDAFIRNDFRRRVRFIVAKENFNQVLAKRRCKLRHIALIEIL